MPPGAVINPDPALCCRHRTGSCSVLARCSIMMIPTIWQGQSMSILKFRCLSPILCVCCDNFDHHWEKWLICTFLVKRYCPLLSEAEWHMYAWLNWAMVTFGSGNCLPSVHWQPITLTNADWCRSTMLFVLNSIYESYVVNENLIIYLSFVDFSKYFDMINRKLWFYKLLKYGITGHVYHVLKSMYDDTRCKVKIRDRYSPSFRDTSGVKQGCSMSPILSNMYQNDLHSIFTEGCGPVQLGETSINSISWAGDLLLVSTSKRGLKTVSMIWRAIAINGAYRWTRRKQSAWFLLNRLTGHTNSSFTTLI